MNRKQVCGIYFVFLAAFAVLCARFYVIATGGSEAQQALSGQYTRKLDIVQRSGFVFDRGGRRLCTANDGYVLFINPSALSPDEYYDAADELSEATGMRASYFADKLFLGAPFTAVAKRLPEGEFGGGFIKAFEKYKDIGDEFLCHVLGYNNADGKGMSGIRGAYSEYLSEYASGKAFARYEADAYGAVIDGTDVMLYDDGYSENSGIYLTIDYEIQDCVENICRDLLDMGAVVVMDTDSGEILAMHSKPVYRKGNVADYLSSERGELLNRSILGYTPGSVFKTAVAAAALEKDISLADREYECRGVIDVFGEKIRCHNTAGHGVLNMEQAFAQSCNPYFIDLGLSLGLETILDTARKMGAREYQSINLLPAAAGNLPENSSGLPAFTANISVGQGELLLTPVQVCSMMSSAATGVYRKPSIVSKLVSDGEETEYGASEDSAEKVLSPETVEKLHGMLEKCVDDGTGWRAKNETVKIAGKTATAQSGQFKDGKEVIHSWFAGYFPADAPKYTVCVLCDGNGKENENASVIFGRIAEMIWNK